MHNIARTVEAVRHLSYIDRMDKAVVGVILMVVVIVPLLVECKCEFKAVFNFGDSNSDTGGFYAAFPRESGPYGSTFFHKPSGRASDGRLVIDFLGMFLLSQ